jgi:hypothetical protein
MKNSVTTEYPYYELTSNTEVISNLPLSFSEYSFFLFPGRLKGDKYEYDAIEHAKLRRRMEDTFGISNADIMHKAGMMFACHKVPKYDLFLHPEEHLEAIQYSYEKMHRISMSTISRAIGHGFTSIVFEYGTQYVIKEAYEEFSPCELYFWDFQMKNSLSIFPKAFYVSDKMIVLERLFTDTPIIGLYRQWIHEYIEHVFEKEVGFRIIKKNILKQDAPFKDFLDSIMKGFNTILGVTTIGDLTCENIAERVETEEIVLLDPLDGKTIKEWSINHV